MEISESQGKIFIPVHNDKHICAGHGTVALEIIQQNPYLDAIVVPVGGGSLLSSLALVVKSVNPRIKVYGVESSIFPYLHTALKNAPVTVSGTSGGLTPYEILKKNVDGVLFVNENARAYAILSLLELEKTVVQGSGVAGLAALMSNEPFRAELEGKQVALVLAGGNIESSLLARVIDKGLVKDGRLTRIRITVEDRYGQLDKVIKLISTFRSNIREVHHERAFLNNENVGHTQTIFTLETRGSDHIQEIINGLKEAGFQKTFLES